MRPPKTLVQHVDTVATFCASRRSRSRDVREALLALSRAPADSADLRDLLDDIDLLDLGDDPEVRDDVDFLLVADRIDAGLLVRPLETLLDAADHGARPGYVRAAVAHLRTVLDDDDVAALLCNELREPQRGLRPPTRKD